MPRKPPKKTRTAKLHAKGDEIKIRVAAEEKTLFESAARGRGLSMSAWIRMVALDAARAVPPRD